MNTRGLFLLFLLGSVAVATAQTPPAPSTPPPEPDSPVIRVGVLSYVQYDAELENRQGFNAFDLTRGYLNVNGQLSKTVRFRLTPDIRRATDSTLAGYTVLSICCMTSKA